MTYYFPLDLAIIHHNDIIKKSGGMAGIKNVGLLESVLFHIQNDDYYPTFEDKITQLVFGVAKNHAFLDGNKRSSIVLGSLFLSLNGYDRYTVKRFINEMETLVLVTVINEITKDDLAEFIALIINDLPYPEELQIKLVKALEVYNAEFNPD